MVLATLVAPGIAAGRREQPAPAPRSSPPSAAMPSAAVGGWQAAALDIPPAWQLTRKRPRVIVAVVDTGVQADHPALRGRVLPGYDFVNHDSDAGDDDGHGTAVAGIIVSNCPVCEILPVKVLAANGTTSNWATIADGITWAADHGAQVIDLSVGAPRAPDVLGAAVSYALARGVIVVAAAGNDGKDELFYPAAYPGVISVAATDTNDSRYPWSNYGSWVTTSAPGCAATTWIGGGYDPDFCGTSTAAPFVAAVAALARAYQPSTGPRSFLTALTASSRSPADATTAAYGPADAGKLLLSLVQTHGGSA